MSKTTASEFDVQAFKKMKEELQMTFDEKVRVLNQTYQKAVNDLQDQYKQHQDQLEMMYQNALMKHNEMLSEQNEAFQKAELETKQANAERQKIQLETKKLMKMKVTTQEMADTSPKVMTNGNEHHVSPRYVQQRVNVRQSASSYGANKKKAADFYFQKGKAQEPAKPTVKKRNSDFMTRDVSPQNGKKSLERKSTLSKKEEANGFSYDRPTQSATMRQMATTNQHSQAYSAGSAGAPTASPQPKVSPNRNPTNGARRSRPDANSWKNGTSTSKKSEPTNAPHRAYVPPALAPKMQNDDLYSYNQSALQQPSSPAFKPSVPSQPELPQKLIDEFKSEPQNYPGLIPALHDGEAFGNCVEKWRKLGVLYAEDIMRNAPNHCPVDYHLRVSENDTQSAFGQVDKNGRMQGIGRECHDFIYEGQFKDNVYHGWGRYISSQGVYWGMFDKGLRHGQGKWVGSGGETREGNWVNGQMK